jgi:DNA-binding CsgD family transcriptional regulator
LLSQRWSLHDVEDVEGLCGKALDTRLRRWGAVLDEQDIEDAVSFLLARSWVLYLKFDPWHEATYKRSFSSSSTAGSTASRSSTGSARASETVATRDPLSSHSSTTPTAASVNWTSLSPTGEATLRIAALISEGFSQAEVAARLGISSQQIAEDLKALCSEIRHQRH